ncbi:MAG: tetratricopeptide repeat protein [Methyloligellaceae bacterium]
MGKEHESVATTLNYLSYLYESDNRLPEAESAARRTLAIHEKNHPEKHSSVQSARKHLKEILQKKSKK